PVTAQGGLGPALARTAPSRNPSSAAGRSMRWAAYSISFALSFRAASAAALVPTEPKRLEYVPDEMDQKRVEVSISSTTVTSSGVSPSSSATLGDTTA